MGLTVHIYTVLAAVSLTVDPEGEVCPGTTVTITCVVDQRSLRWTLNNGGTHITLSGNTSGLRVGAFSLRATVESGVITSTVVATADVSLDGAEITCTDVLASGTPSMTLTLQVTSKY